MTSGDIPPELGLPKKPSTKAVGKRGEEAVANHLRRNGYKIIEMNHLRKWGEIDVVARKGNTVHFVEVKTVSREMGQGDVSHGTSYRPEENVHQYKLKKLLRVVQTWLSEQGWEGEWQVDVAAVVLDKEQKRGSIKLIENVVLE